MRELTCLKHATTNLASIDAKLMNALMRLKRVERVQLKKKPQSVGLSAVSCEELMIFISGSSLNISQQSLFATEKLEHHPIPVDLHHDVSITLIVPVDASIPSNPAATPTNRPAHVQALMRKANSISR